MTETHRPIGWRSFPQRWVQLLLNGSLAGWFYTALAAALVPVAFLTTSDQLREATQRHNEQWGWNLPLGSETWVDEAAEWLSAPRFTLFTAVMLWHTGRRLRAHKAVRLLADDRRAPVLYLRRFQVDDDLARYREVLLGTDEERVLRGFRPLGPVIAVGSPSDLLPTPGAARFHVPADRWQAVVAGLMPKARAAVIRVGSSPALLWELQLSRTTMDPRRLFLIGSNEDYHACAPALKQLFGLTVPPRSEMKKSWAVVTFDAHWNPHASVLRLLRLSRETRRLTSVVPDASESDALAIIRSNSSDAAETYRLSPLLAGSLLILSVLYVIVPGNHILGDRQHLDSLRSFAFQSSAILVPQLWRWERRSATASRVAGLFGVLIVACNMWVSPKVLSFTEQLGQTELAFASRSWRELEDDRQRAAKCEAALPGVAQRYSAVVEHTHFSVRRGVRRFARLLNAQNAAECAIWRMQERRGEFRPTTR